MPSSGALLSGLSAFISIFVIRFRSRITTFQVDIICFTVIGDYTLAELLQTFLTSFFIPTFLISIIDRPFRSYAHDLNAYLRF